MVLWGVSFVASKVVLQQLTPLTYMATRFAIAALILGVLLWMRGFPRMTGKTHLLIALTALAEPVAYFLFESYGLQRTTATTASLIIATIPLAVMVVARIILGEPIPRQGFIAVVISLAGISLLVAGARSASGDSSVIGILLVFGAVISAAFYITLARKLTQHHSPLVITTLQTGYGALAFGLLWIVQPAAVRIPQLDTAGWGALAFLVVGATVGAFLLYNFALRHESAGTASLYINAIPVVTAITGWLLLNERLTVVQLAGGLLVLIAVRIATWVKAPAVPVELA